MDLDRRGNVCFLRQEEEERCIEGRDKSAYDGDKDGNGDNANKCEFLTNPGLQGSTEACKAIVSAPTRRTKTPATHSLMKKMNFSQVLSPEAGLNNGNPSLSKEKRKMSNTDD